MSSQTYAGVIVKCNNKILLCKRSKKASYANSWSIPQGKVEMGENTMDGAKREFYEETNIDISNEPLKFEGVVIRTNKSDTKIKGPLFIYSIDVGEEVQPDLELAIDGHEHSDHGYFSIDEMKNLYMDNKMYNFLEKKFNN